VGDEAYWLSQQTGLPVVVGSNRAKAIQTLLQAHPEIDCLLMDDGWQHKKVQTDGALLVWDERGLGNGRLLPQGPLREPWPPASSDRVPQALIHMRQHRQEASDSHDKAVPTVPTLPGIPSFEVTRRLACYAQDRLGRQRAYFEGELIAVAGIAKPEVFFSMLGQAPWNLALKPEDAWALPDHASFDTKSVVQRIQAALDQGKTLLCTEKDAVKLWALWPDAAIWAVPLILDIPFDFWTWWDQSRAKDPCLAMSQLS
jgi:tetraacyldisaccharide 4'-kinase